MKKPKVQIAVRPREVLGKLARESGTALHSIGDVERLAGINTQSESERRALWDKFKHLYAGPAQVLIDAVMDHCAAIALQRIAGGELSLVRMRFAG